MHTGKIWSEDYMYLSVCLSACLSVCLSVCLSACLSVCVSGGRQRQPWNIWGPFRWVVTPPAVVPHHGTDISASALPFTSPDTHTHTHAHTGAHTHTHTHTY